MNGKQMARRILGALASLWGAVILFHGNSYPEDRDVVGDMLTLIIGGLLLSVGMYFLLKRSKPNRYP
jgi:hypothetical protein